MYEIRVSEALVAPDACVRSESLVRVRERRLWLLDALFFLEAVLISKEKREKKECLSRCR